MDPESGADQERSPERPLALPDVLADGATVLVAGALDPSEHAICLGLLARHGSADDTALVVTSRASAGETVETWLRTSNAAARPAIGIVDTTSAEQSVAATYGDVPTIFTPSSGDLERIVMALSALSGTVPRTERSRHLVFRSMTPVLRDAPPEHVCRVVQRIVGLRTGAGLGLFGVDVTAHDRETLTMLADTVDGVVWVDRSNDGQFEATFDPRRSRVPF